MSERDRPDAYDLEPINHRRDREHALRSMIERRLPAASVNGMPVPNAAARIFAELEDLRAQHPPVLDAEEQAVMDHIYAAMAGIHALGLKANAVELASAVHVLQGFVVQHMLQRLAPGAWGRWYDLEVPDAG